MADGADIIVVGAGAAGGVIAARATERSDREVLLLDAGPDYPIPESLPADLRNGKKNSMTAHDWGFHHKPTPSGAPFVFPRGRVVGGSSAVNTCIALRGMPYDYDEWAARGLPEWSWEKCRPAFLRLESDLDFPDAEHHSSDGPIPIRRHAPSEIVLWQQAFLDACASLGFPQCADHNDPRETGYAPFPMNKVDGERMSVARCYLTPEVRARKNLRIEGDTLVRRVLFEGRRAVGVEVERGGKIEVLHAKKVILCGGAVLTPGILLRSGVGPADELARLGVSAVAEVAGVGRVLLDHPGFAIVLIPREGVCSVNDPVVQTALRYRSEVGGRRNDMQLQAGSFFPLPRADVPVVSIAASVGKPRGTGRIRFPSADPRAKPKLDSRFLVDPDDLEAAAEAMELAMLCATSPAMKDMASFFMPGERDLMSRREIRKWVPQQCSSGYHPSGTVPMGADDDPNAATDQHGRVRGTEGLHVADASLMPTVPTANIHLPTIMIGERFGEWLRDGTI